MVIAQTTEPPTVTHTIRTEPRNGSPLETLEGNNQAHPILEEEAASGIAIAADVFEVHFKPTENRESQITQNHVVQNDDWICLS